MGPAAPDGGNVLGGMGCSCWEEPIRPYRYDGARVRLEGSPGSPGSSYQGSTGMMRGHLAVVGVCVVVAGAVEALARQPGGEAAALAAIERAKTAYASLRTYQDTCVIVNEAVAEGNAEPVTQEVRFTLKFAAPRSIALRSAFGEVYCDGTTLWLVNTQLKEYIASAAPQRLDLEELTEQHPQLQALGHAAANFITRGDRNPKLLSKRLRNVTSVTPEVRRGLPGQRIEGTGDHPPFEDVRIDLWMNDQSGLIEEAFTDLTAAYQRMIADMPAFAGDDGDAGALGMEAPEYTRVGYTVRLEGIRVNEEIPAEAFTYKPADGVQLVEEFSNPWERGQSDQQELVGKPAPDFGDEGLDGKPLKLSGLKGRVVLLDFWATWCGPCVQAIPHVQELSERFKDRPVTVIGVNQDHGNKAAVEKFVEKRALTFPQFMDDGEVGRAYSVSGIPCSVLIDQEGLVQKVSVGFMPGQEDELAEDIEALLTGKRLAEPARVVAAETGPGGADAAAEPGDRKPVTGMTPLNEGALTSGKASAGVFLNEYQSRRFDLDGDGRPEVIGPTPQGGGLTVLSGDGQEISRVKAKLPRGSFPTSFEVVRNGDQTCWLIVSQTASMGGMGRPTVGLYRSDGSEAWTYKPEMSDKSTGQVMLAAGNLSGDAAPEFAILVSAFQMDRSGQMAFNPRNQSAFLVILDDQGRERVRRKVGRSGSLVHIAPSVQPDVPPTIVVSCDGKLQRFTADLSAAPIADKDETPKP